MTYIWTRAFLKFIFLGEGCMRMRALSLRPHHTHMPRPNIILALSDDQGWGEVGYRGHSHLRTPALDDMAANGANDCVIFYEKLILSVSKWVSSGFSDDDSIPRHGPCVRAMPVCIQRYLLALFTSHEQRYILRVC